jgi:hypothetical protein
MELHPHRMHFRLLILAFFVGICAIVAGLLYTYGYFDRYDGRAGMSSTRNIRQVSPTQIPLKQLFSLSEMETIAQVGEEISVEILSNVSDLTSVPLGFDCLLEVMGAEYEIVRIDTLISDYKTIHFQKSQHMTITSILEPSSKNPPLWYDGLSVMSVILKPKSSGRMTFRISDNKGKETTKILLSSNKNGKSGISEKLLSAPSDAVHIDISD